MIKGLVLGLQFLTRIPINIPVDFNEKNLQKTVFYFPFIGMLIGGIGGFVHYIFNYINSDLAAIMTVIILIALTGGLHLDGLTDTFDGFFSYREKEKVLEIMRDSRIGTFGAIGLILDILLKYIIIVNLKENIPLILALSYGNSRFVAAYLMSSKRNSRKDGIGHMFSQSKPKKYFLLGALFFIIIIIIINPLYLIPLLANFILGEMMAKISYKKIDGFTGDVYGATIEIGEILSLIIFLGGIQWI